MRKTETKTFRVVFTDGRRKPRIVEAESVSTINRGNQIIFTARGSLDIRASSSPHLEAATVERIEGTEDEMCQAAAPERVTPVIDTHRRLLIHLWIGSLKWVLEAGYRGEVSKGRRTMMDKLIRAPILQA